ncbi:MAG: carbamoyl-phosphate synthase large subunit, partial [Kangiellaceae bacterium]|nr:carbamoyl-phosphate synthase large subunit [Kangiellaceae bacterium]
ECTLQRNHQKLLEVAPSPTLDEDTRQSIISSALKLASRVKYQGLGTFEFLLDAKNNRSFYFMEANPRIQVEHTVTEEITGLDLVQLQVQLAEGCTLEELDLVLPPKKNGYAIQVRINAELMSASGSVSPTTGVLTNYQTSAGLGVRVDGYGYQNYHVTPAYDSLIAKLIVRGNDYLTTINKTHRALREFVIEGIDTNKTILLNLLQHTKVKENNITTRFIEQHLADLLNKQSHPELCFNPTKIDGVRDATNEIEIPSGCEGVLSPSVGVLVELCVNEGDSVFEGQTLAHLEAMKMEFPVIAPYSGTIVTIASEINLPIDCEQLMFVIALSEVNATESHSEEELDLDSIRDDLSEVLERHEKLYDQARPNAVHKRHKIGMRTARENINDLLDEDSFNEYGAMIIAAQRKRFSVDELKEVSPADGLVAGTGSINSSLFDHNTSRCIAMAYDYTVFAGTQGVMNHKKMDRMLGLAKEWRIPVILFAEGGGGRPSDTDFNGIAGLDCHTFVAMAALSGLVPTVGIAAGRCFAGNAALLGVCDVIIATASASIGMAGPAMIEGGGLGKFRAEEVGPVTMQSPNGVIDILVENEAEAVAVAKKYLSYFQGETPDWQSDDQRKLRHYIPQNRMRIYNIRDVINTIADSDSVLEIRREFAPGIITSFVRIEGKPFGLIANNPNFLGGAIDAVSGDKISRFMQLCDAFDIPIISLCDTPGFMVGPEAEKQATVRHIARIFVVAASLTVPFFTIVLRKGYGLGAQAMAAGSMHSPVFTASWPTGEFGAMGIEGAITLAFTKQLAAAKSKTERDEMFKLLVDKAYENGKALNMASYMEIDAVIDPVDTRKWVLRGLRAMPKLNLQSGKKRSFIDTW